MQQACRIVHIEPTAPENDDGDFDPEVALQEVQKKDPFEPRLKPITDDRPIYGKTPAWIVRLIGDNAEYTNPSMPSKPESHAVVVIRSLQWPGAFTFYSASRGLLSVYVGEGQKFDAV